MLLGEFEHSIDDKGRLTVPAKFRGRLAVGLVVTKAIDPCLWLYPIDTWDELSAKIQALPLTDPKAREFRRQVFGGAADSVPDRQGRVILPPYLREYAAIDKQAIIIGLHDHMRAGVLSAEHGGMGWYCPLGRRDRVFIDRRRFGKGIDVRRGSSLVTIALQTVGTLRIQDQEDDVWVLFFHKVS